MLQLSLSSVLAASIQRLRRPMTREDWLNLADVLEGQVRCIREVFDSPGLAPVTSTEEGGER